MVHRVARASRAPHCPVRAGPHAALPRGTACRVGCALDPTADLREAVAIFESLGAASWEAQGCALRDSIPAHGEPSVGELLSPAERRVTEAVVAGLTNRDVASLLFVSEKTVEFHLHNVYRKLGVHSRTQLVRRLSG